MSDENLFYYLYYECQAIHGGGGASFSALCKSSPARHVPSRSDLCSEPPNGMEQQSRLLLEQCPNVQSVRAAFRLETGAAERKVPCPAESLQDTLD